MARGASTKRPRAKRYGIFRSAIALNGWLVENGLCESSVASESTVRASRFPELAVMPQPVTADDVRDEEEWRGDAYPPVGGGGKGASAFLSQVIERVAGEAEDAEDDDEREAGGAVLARLQACAFRPRPESCGTLPMSDSPTPTIAT